MEYNNLIFFFYLFIFIALMPSTLQIIKGENIQKFEQYIEQIIADSKPDAPIWNARKPKGWDYVDGCIIGAFLELCYTTQNTKYFNFAKDFEDYRVNDDGEILTYDRLSYNLDNVNSAKTFLTLYQITKDKKYRKGAARVYQQLLEHPRTKEGNFWHKKVYTEQVWLDGLYMALPFYMEYEVLFQNSKNINDIYNQLFNVYELMRDKETGLYYHGYDSAKQQPWANKTTGLSLNFWLRSLGWYSMALLDTLNKASDKGSENWDKLKNIFIELCESMLKFQDESGMWYDVVNFPDREPNYLETSGSAMYSYSFLKGYRLKILEDIKFKEAGLKAFNEIIERYLRLKNGKLSLGGTVSVSGLSDTRNGTFEYYMSEPIAENDAKGIGPMILAYNEYLLLE